MTHQAQIILTSLLTPRQLHAMCGIYAVLFLLGLETTIGGSILPQASEELNGIERFGWIGTLQMLASACATPVTARLGDIWSRKWLLFIAIVLLCIAGLLACFASSMDVLLASRVLNGIALGMMAGSAFAVPADVFSDPSQRVRWQSIGGVMFALASSMGPLLGAMLSELFGWRIALLVVPAVGLPVLMLLFCMPNLQRGYATRQQFDVLGAVLMCTFIATSLLGVQNLGKSPTAWLWMIAGAISLGLMWRQQTRVEQPILALEILKNTQVRVMALTTLLSGAVLTILLFYSPLILTTLGHMSFREAGLVMLPLLVGMPAGSLLNGMLFCRVSKPQYLFWSGTVLLLVGSIIVASLLLGLPTPILMLGYGFCGIGLGFINQNQTLFIQMVTPQRFLGAATGLISTARNYGGALGSAALSLAMIKCGLESGLAIILLASTLCVLLILPISLRIHLP